MIRDFSHLGLHLFIKKNKIKQKKKKKKKIGHSSNEIISDDLYVANTLNKYFQNTVTKLGITECPDNFSTNTTALGYPV